MVIIDCREGESGWCLFLLGLPPPPPWGHSAPVAPPPDTPFPFPLIGGSPTRGDAGTYGAGGYTPIGSRALFHPFKTGAPLLVPAHPHSHPVLLPLVHSLRGAIAHYRALTARSPVPHPYIGVRPQSPSPAAVFLCGCPAWHLPCSSGYFLYPVALRHVFGLGGS